MNNEQCSMIVDHCSMIIRWCAVLAVTACGPRNPCSGHQFQRLRRYSLPYAGRWIVARGDTVTFPAAPQVSDHFKLGEIVLDTTTVIADRDCVCRGKIVFRAPRADTITPRELAHPERPTARRWPAAPRP